MRCKTFRKLTAELEFSSYSSAQKQHYERCQDCRDWVLKMLRLQKIYRLRAYEHPGSALEARLVESVSGKIAGKSPEPLVLNAADAFLRYAAAAALLMLAFIYGLQMQPVPEVASHAEPMNEVDYAQPQIATPRMVLIEPVVDLTPGIPYAGGFSGTATDTNRNADLERLLRQRSPIVPVRLDY